MGFLAYPRFNSSTSDFLNHLPQLQYVRHRQGSFLLFQQSRLNQPIQLSGDRLAVQEDQVFAGVLLNGAASRHSSPTLVTQISESFDARKGLR